MTPPRVLAALLAATVGSGCLEVDGADVVIDLDRHTIVVDLHGLRDDLSEYLKLSEPKLLMDTPRAVQTGLDYVVVGERLDARVTATVATPADAGLMRATPDGPLRWCPTQGLVVVRANAAARDADGCVLFPRGTRVARLALVRATPSQQESMLPAFRAWDARGRPRGDAPAPSPEAPDGAPTAPPGP